MIFDVSEGSLEVKLPTKLADESRDGMRHRRKSEEHVREEKVREEKIKEEFFREN